MADAYDDLVVSGAIGAFKADILLETARDVEYLAHIRKRFEEDHFSAESAKAATACTVRIVQELIEKNLCSLATWIKGDGSFEVVEKPPEELFELVGKYKSFDQFPFDFFLVATDKGKNWVTRYNTLLNEL